MNVTRAHIICTYIRMCVCVRYLCGLDELIDQVDGVLTAVWLTHYHGNTLRADAIIWRRQAGRSQTFNLGRTVHSGLYQHKQTCFKLDPDSCIVLYLLDHFSVPADHDADSEPWYWDLQRDRLDMNVPFK